MIGFARSFSITNQSSSEPSTQTPIATASPNATDDDCLEATTAAHAPAIIKPSRPKCGMPERWASTPASVT